MSWMRVVGWLIAAVVGVAYGAAGTISHATFVGPIPIGLVLSLIGAAALLLAIRLLVGDRWATLAAGLGMMLITLLFSGRGPGGSVLVPATVLGTIWTIGLPVIVALLVAWPSVAAVRPRSGN